MRNAEIAAALRELGVLYELDGADRYRTLAYQEAARTAAQSPVSLEQLAAEGRLTELQGVGKTIAEKLKAKFPPTLVEVTRVPGLGAKTARRIFDELGVTNLEELKQAAEAGQLREMKGLGPKAEENVLSALDGLAEEGPGERMLLS